MNTISSHFPIISKPATTLGKQVKVPGSHWEGRLTEGKNTMYLCTIFDFIALHTFLGGGCKVCCTQAGDAPAPTPAPAPAPRCPGARLRAYHTAHRAASSSTFRPLDPSQVLEPPPLDPGS